MSDRALRPLSLSVEKTDGGNDIIINGMSLGANIKRDSIEVRWDHERRLPCVTVTFFVDEFSSKGGWSGMVPSGSGLTTRGAKAVSE